MKCPHCGYESDRINKGEKGSFFHTYTEWKRTTDNFFVVSEVTMYGCPSCRKVFIEFYRKEK